VLDLEQLLLFGRVVKDDRALDARVSRDGLQLERRNRSGQGVRIVDAVQAGDRPSARFGLRRPTRRRRRLRRREEEA